MKGKGIIFGVAICVLLGSCMLAVSLPAAFGKEPVGEELRIGVLGVFSGPAAAWGLTTKYCAIVSAEMLNEEGGLLLDGVRHPIKLFIEDTKFDVKVARAAAEKLAHRDKVKYICGPNTSPTCAAAQVVAEPAKVIYVGYGFTTSLWTPEHPYGIMGMVTPDQSAPVLYKYLMEKHGVKTISLVAKNYAGGLNTRKSAGEAAKKLGLEIISDKETYEPDVTDFFPVMSKVVKDNPDVIDLTAAGAGDAAQAVKAARQLGYKGIMGELTSGDIETFNEIGGKYMDGFFCIGGATTPDIRTKKMEAFMERYKKVAGEWNDEAGTKIYAFDMIMETIKVAGPAALTDTDAFRAAMPKVRYQSPYIQGNPIIKYVGKSTFGHNQQIGVPLVIFQVEDGKFKVVKVTAIED